MITLEQIKLAHSKVKSGADFPAYIQQIKQMGVTAYETFVSDSHTEYATKDGQKLVSAPKYDALEINSACKAEQFKSDLKSHQHGKTDYFTFCEDCAKSGIEKWVVCMDEMTCTYYSKQGELVLVETIPY